MTQDDLPEPTGGDGSHPGAHGTSHRLGSPRLSDLDAYRLLVRLGHTTQHLAPRCCSTAAATALAAAAHTLRALTSALYRANIDDHSKLKSPNDIDGSAKQRAGCRKRA